MSDLISYLREINSMISSMEGGRLIRNIILTAISVEIIALVYIKFGNAISDKKSFAKNFFLISVTTMLVITFIKGSLALSLGLVGALSIIRFRTAIKEPEELAFLFLTIGIGLGYGAGYVALTVLALGMILFIIFIKWAVAKKTDNQNLFINFATVKEENFNADDLIELLKEHTSTLKLKRYDESRGRFEATFNATFSDIKKLNQCKTIILSRFPESDLTYVEVENY
ncbi:DUF4956 domain-containing protein [Catalinimonas niigatensis]|uniref:DUF4956 domain-containing protein n=1 Tax=Catalinimonas niigatensis TaxID=1397264 RepID=UPI002667196B|nr:DUF4956 domain-containing protein [Catalinimonas niigatensis]WPP52371.1 DUF4956 domain-containing protein [Catalinimonas niigatensis]